MRAVEPPALTLEPPPRAPLEPCPRAVEPFQQLGQVGDDEPACHARSGRAHVRREVAEGRVLLVADRADDRHRTVGDRPHQTLVAEGQQVFEAAAAAGHDHDVDALAAERAQGLDDRAGGARALDVGLRDEHVRRREAGRDRSQDVALGGGVVPGHEADPRRQQGHRPLAFSGEKPFGGQLRLQALERGQVLAEPEALERERPQAELAARLEQLRRP